MSNIVIQTAHILPCLVLIAIKSAVEYFSNFASAEAEVLLLIVTHKLNGRGRDDFRILLASPLHNLKNHST